MITVKEKDLEKVHILKEFNKILKYLYKPYDFDILSKVISKIIFKKKK